MQVNMHEAKSDLSRLVVRALAGEEVIITRAGKPVARLVPIRPERVPGLARGKVQLAPDFDAPLPEDVLADFESR
jgi:prevent-host-death family protein